LQIYVNGRFRSHKVTGVQRYAWEITSRLGLSVNICEPRRKLTGSAGHIWEQVVLPMRSQNGVLWSPCNAGPMFVPNHVVTFHDLFALEMPQWYSRKYAAWYRVLFSALARSARHIIAVSNYTRSRVLEVLGVGEAKISVVHNGVSDQFKPVSDDLISAARQTVNLYSDKYFLSLGSVEPRKNLHRLLSAWKEVLPELPSALWLVIAGSADASVYRDAGIENIPPRVHFTGYVPDEHLVPLYCGSIGFVYPSLAEGFGLPPLEAMACGVPVLTAKGTSIPEVCGSAAIYVDPLSITDIAAGLKTLATDRHLQDTLRRLGPRQASRFTWDTAAARTLAILENCSF
jgi:glycosyltransferase involved in cell wall biosynthesis